MWWQLYLLTINATETFLRDRNVYILGERISIRFWGILNHIWSLKNIQIQLAIITCHINRSQIFRWANWSLFCKLWNRQYYIVVIPTPVSRPVRVLFIYSYPKPSCEDLHSFQELVCAPLFIFKNICRIS